MLLLKRRIQQVIEEKIKLCGVHPFLIRHAHVSEYHIKLINSCFHMRQDNENSHQAHSKLGTDKYQSTQHNLEKLIIRTPPNSGMIVGALEG